MYFIMFVFICMYSRVCLRLCQYLRENVPANVYVFINVCVYVCMCTCLCIYLSASVCICTYVCVCLWTRMCVCVRVFACGRIYLCACCNTTSLKENDVMLLHQRRPTVIHQMYGCNCAMKKVMKTQKPHILSLTHKFIRYNTYVALGGKKESIKTESTSYNG